MASALAHVAQSVGTSAGGPACYDPRVVQSCKNARVGRADGHRQKHDLGRQLCQIAKTLHPRLLKTVPMTRAILASAIAMLRSAR
jgi:hypothetical protein